MTLDELLRLIDRAARESWTELDGADPAANRLSISLDGPTPQRRHLLAVVRAQLAEIHASFPQLETEAWVALLGQPALVRNLVLHFLKQGRLSVLEEKVWAERPYL